MKSNITTAKQIYKYMEGELHEQEDAIVLEQPLTIIVNGEEFATLVCSPEHLDELVLGFLASEGVIRFHDDIHQLSIDEEQGFAYVDLSVPLAPASSFSKRFIGSCCGKSRQFYLLNDVKTAKTITTSTRIRVEQCFALMNTLQNESTVFRHTGGVHNAALCNEEGMIIARSDIGRHNALDKIYGYCLRHAIPMRDKLVAFSGRVSSEILLKASKMGAGIVLSKSAPTDLALQLADDLHMTVVGFIRGTTLNIYTHPERIIV
ncbi:Protein FdhD [Anoxybacillus sp. P3H1B]|nr:Protein FdhD [Anoxybacillus sp. P3H1B]MBS2770963.1 formate dehydrogenase accessory sulfurtransferase FdhD [Anoxybacillus rupiensis]